MMLPLHITLFAASLLTFGYTTVKIRDSKMRLEDSLFWFCFSALLLLASIFLRCFSDFRISLAPWRLRTSYSSSIFSSCSSSALS